MIEKRYLTFILLFCFVGLFVGSLQIREAKATLVTITRTFTSLSYDGYAWNFGPNYGAVRNATTASAVIDSYPYFRLGQQKTGDLYYVWRAFVFFGTSIIPDGANITEAKLSLDVNVDYSTTDFNVTIQNGQPTYPHTPLEAGDYNKAWYSGNGGKLSTSGIGTGYKNITLTELDWISLTGTTKLCLRSSRDIDNLQPSDDENLKIYTQEQGEAYAPKLYVTYETEGYCYFVHGPYWESGSVAAKTVNLTLQIENMPPQSYTLDGTDGVVDDLNITVEQRGVAFTWNISDYSNYTRTYYLTNASFEELCIFIPDIANEAVNLYTFSVTDFVGVSNGYLETVINVAGYNRIVERQKLDVVNSMPFWMVWARRYDVRLVCDQGTYIWGGFIPLSEQTQSLIIFAGMFPTTYPGLDVTVNATRMNATWIQINYVDSQLLTSSVTVTIEYRKGYGWETAYSTTNTGNTQQINWYSANPGTDYIVYVTATRTDQTYSWSFGCSKPATATNPWDIDWGIGNSPIPLKNIIGLALVLIVFGLSSYAYLPLGCILGVIMAGFLTSIRWLDLSWNLIGLALAIAIFAAIAHSKKEEREL